MAFETGVATSITDLWTKIKTFATAELGWTELGTAGTGPVGTMFQTPAGAYLGVGYDPTGDTNAIGLCVSAGFTGGVGFASQPGTSWKAYSYPVIGPITFPTTSYWFFGEAEYLHFIVEDVPGQFWHGCLGTLNKNYSYSGGQFACGTSSGDGNPLGSGKLYPFGVAGGQPLGLLKNNAILVNGVSTDMGSSYASFYATPSTLGYNSALSTYSMDDQRANNDLVGRTVLHPIYVYARGTFGGLALNNIVGTAPNIANCTLNYIGGKGVLTLGSDTWYLFPIRKYYPSMSSQGPGTVSSGLLGLAYKRVD